MKNTIQAVLLICVFVVAMLVLFSRPMRENPKLAVFYLNQTNAANHYVAFFAITNIGNVTVSGYSSGCIERFGSNKLQRVLCEARLPRLQPGDADIAKVFLPTAIKGRWRFTIAYERDGSYSESSPDKEFATTEWIQ